MRGTRCVPSWVPVELDQRILSTLAITKGHCNGITHRSFPLDKNHHKSTSFPHLRLNICLHSATVIPLHLPGYLSIC